MALLSIIMFVWAYFPSLSRSLWMASLLVILNIYVDSILNKVLHKGCQLLVALPLHSTHSRITNVFSATVSCWHLMVIL